MKIPGPADIEAAAGRIVGRVQVTPVIESTLFGSVPIGLKLENLQRSGSFKPRGAFNTLLSTPVPEAGVVAASGGNHGAAVAYAARALGHRAVVFVPELSSPAKRSLIRDAGADLRVVPGAYADAAAAAARHRDETGAMEIHAYDAPATVAGQGTLFREWEAQGLDADTVLVAVGGGGLIAGALAWFAGRRRVVAVESEGTATLRHALDRGVETATEVSGLAADALGARRIGRIAHRLATDYGVLSLTVPDAAIADAQRALWQGHRQFVEPAGAAALAALTSGAYAPGPGERVAVLVCGANPAPGPFNAAPDAPGGDPRAPRDEG